MSVASSFRRLSAPKKALAGTVLAAATAGTLLASAPAQAATSDASSAQRVAKKMIADSAQFQCFSNIVDHESDWNPHEWGVDYMKDRYGSPCGAWDFWQSNGWY